MTYVFHRRRTESDKSTIYLLHYLEPIGNGTPTGSAQHYAGSTDNLSRRLRQAASGQGAKIEAAFFAAGIPFELARTTPGSYSRERQIKASGGFSRYCPLCTDTPRTGLWGPVTTQEFTDPWAALPEASREEAEYTPENFCSEPDIEAEL